MEHVNKIIRIHWYKPRTSRISRTFCTLIQTTHRHIFVKGTFTWVVVTEWMYMFLVRVRLCYFIIVNLWRHHLLTIICSKASVVWLWINFVSVVKCQCWRIKASVKCLISLSRCFSAFLLPVWTAAALPDRTQTVFKSFLFHPKSGWSAVHIKRSASYCQHRYVAHNNLSASSLWTSRYQSKKQRSEDWEHMNTIINKNKSLHGAESSSQQHTVIG